MRPVTVIILGVAAVAVGAVLVRSAARAVYFDQRDALLKTITDRSGVLDGFARERKEHAEIRAQLQRVADHSLGGTVETVEATLRARLNRIVEAVGLASTSVSTSTAVPKASPAQRKISRQNPRRDEPDFIELDATVSGEGTLEQVVRLAHFIESEPWHRRINSLTIDPNPDGTRFSVTARLTTMFLAGLNPGAIEEAEYDPASADRYMAFVATEPFRVPAPPEVQVAQSDPPPPPRIDPPRPPSFPYGKWSLTAVTDGSRGVEAWLINRESGERRTLLPGESISEMEFLAATGDRAEFRLGESRFIVEVGSTLKDRQPFPG